MQDLKELLKEVYEFVDNNQIQCFHSCGYDYHPKVTLAQLVDPKFKGQPNVIIHLNTSSPNYLKEKKLVQDRFPHYFYAHSSYY
jgi:hypothetical protein